jgi:Flp pilus assembly protein CpaB
VQKDQLKLFAIADPAAIKGRIAAADIFPGQQLTQGDFTTEATASIPYQITGTDRAIAIPVDSAHGLVGQVSAGNFVDVYVGVSASSGTVKLLASNILVLVAPGANAVLRVPTSEAPKFAFAADNAKIWLVLRPQVGASRTPPASATLASLLAGGR